MELVDEEGEGKAETRSTRFPVRRILVRKRITARYVVVGSNWTEGKRRHHLGWEKLRNTGEGGGYWGEGGTEKGKQRAKAARPVGKEQVSR